MTEAHAETLPPATRLIGAQQRRILILVVVAIVALALLVMLVRSLTAAPAPVAAPNPAGALRLTPAQMRQITVAPVGLGEQGREVQASGTISVDADNSTPILLPFSAQIAAVLVEPGDRVARGQPLLRVVSGDLGDARNAVQAAAGQVASTTEALALAETNAARQKQIFQTAGGALKDYQQAQADLITARAAKRSAEAALTAARGRLGLFSGNAGIGADGLYRSPVSGLVADRNVAAGQFVTAGSSALMTITDPSTVWLVAQLPEDQAAQARIGDSVTVTTPALPGRTFAARIDNVAAALDPVTRRLAVRATVRNPDGALKPQMFATFTIRGRAAGGEALLVPAAAVIYEGDGARVWVLGRDGLLRSRTVTLGETQSGRTRILSGLVAGDRVVTSGAIFVNEAGLEG